jgi:hypothetical protein
MKLSYTGLFILTKMATIAAATSANATVPTPIVPKPPVRPVQQQQTAPIVQQTATPTAQPTDWSQKFRDYWYTQENSVKSGWDNKQQKWYPHKSLEGGTPTVAYGIKLNDPKLQQQANAGIDDATAKQWVDNHMQQSLNSMQQIIDAQYGKGTFAKLPDNRKYALLDIHMNVNRGIKAYPKFTQHAVNNNLAGMRNEYQRYYTPSGSTEKQPLVNRNKAFYDLFLQQ